MTREHDEILTEKTDRLRTASGTVTSSNPMVCFLYLLARDLAPLGEIEELLGDVEIAGMQGSCQFTNGWLAQWAQDAAYRLTP